MRDSDAPECVAGAPVLDGPAEGDTPEPPAQKRAWRADVVQCVQACDAAQLCEVRQDEILWGGERRSSVFLSVLMPCLGLPENRLAPPQATVQSHRSASRMEPDRVLVIERTLKFACKGSEEPYTLQCFMLAILRDSSAPCHLIPCR